MLVINGEGKRENGKRNQRKASPKPDQKKTQNDGLLASAY
jgi:hypothetical protein